MNIICRNVRLLRYLKKTQKLNNYRVVQGIGHGQNGQPIMKIMPLLTFHNIHNISSF